MMAGHFLSQLVDASIWVDYFRRGGHSEKFDFLIDENLTVTNDLILSDAKQIVQRENLLVSLTRFDLRFRRFPCFL